MLNLVVRKVHYAAYHFTAYSNNTTIRLESVLCRFSLVLPVFQGTSPEVSHQNFVRSCLLFVRVPQHRPSLLWRFVTPLLSPKLKLPFFAVCDYVFNIFAPRLPLVCLHVAHWNWVQTQIGRIRRTSICHIPTTSGRTAVKWLITVAFQK